MTEHRYEPDSIEALAQEVREWEDGTRTLEGWVDAPEKIPNIGKSTLIDFRVPTDMLTILKEFARRERIGYQVLMKRWLDDRIREERDKLRKKIEKTGSSSEG
jgi:hypothetical protein